MDADVTKNRSDSPKIRRDRLTALISALRPVAHLCPRDDPRAVLFVHPDRLVLRLRGTDTAAGRDAELAIRVEVAIPLHEALRGTPDCVTLATNDTAGLRQLALVLLDEARGARCGSGETIARLSEALLVLVLRRVLDGAPPDHGVLAGLSHPRLHHAIVAVHSDPGAAWSVESLAGLAGMSRSRFMATFRDLIGLSPLAYVTRWRVELARAALSRGAVPREVARQVGYRSLASLRRAMRRHGAC